MHPAVEIRKLDSGDFELVKRLWGNPSVRKYLGGTKSPKDIKTGFERLLSSTETHCFACLFANSKCGVLYLHKYRDGTDYEISYEFLPEYWGKGLAFSALQQLLKKVQSMHIPVVYAETQLKNTRSRKLLQNLGMHEVKQCERFGETQVVYKQQQPDKHYVTPELAALYDAGCGWGVDRDFYVTLPKKEKQRILDLGCGTGLICHAMAKQGHLATGIDPATEMLAIARTKNNHPNTRWVQAFCQSLELHKKLNETFDLIIMTGHAFQVLLHTKEVTQTFNNVKSLLAPEGRFVFESRNPAFDWGTDWNYDLEMQVPVSNTKTLQTVQESRRLLSFDGDFIDFELRYQFSDKTFAVPSRLKFWQQHEIEELLLKSGLKSVNCSGDWDGSSFESGSTRSKEMIFDVAHA